MTSKPTDYELPFISYDMLLKEIKKRLMKAIKYMHRDKHGFERLIATIQAEINLFSTYRTYKYPNLLEVIEYA